MADDYYGGGDFGSAGTGAYGSYGSYGGSTGEGVESQGLPYGRTEFSTEGSGEGDKPPNPLGTSGGAQGAFDPNKYWPAGGFSSAQGGGMSGQGGYNPSAGFGSHGSSLGAAGGAGGSMIPGVAPNLGAQKLGLISPYVKSVLGSTVGSQVGGQAGPQPAINTNPIYSPQQIQQQMNAAFSSNDSRTATLMKQLMESSAARGFGGNSPAMQAQQTQLGIANNVANATAQREIPLQYAQPNADQAYRVNQLQQTQWQQQQDQDIRRRQIQQQQLGQLLGFFGSFA